jgi:hypothetical protein
MPTADVKSVLISRMVKITEWLRVRADDGTVTLTIFQVKFIMLFLGDLLTYLREQR